MTMGLQYDNSFTWLCWCPVPRRARVRGGAELLGGSLVIISMQATAISMQMPGSGPGGAVVHNTPGQGSTPGFLHFSLQLWSSVTAHSQQTQGRDTDCAIIGAEG